MVVITFSSFNWLLRGLAVQKALKEKQEHVEQLLKERDLERSEFAKTAAQIDDVSISRHFYDMLLTFDF